MKVSIAVIKLVLRTNKVLADGSHPIMLRCSFNGMKERSTGYSCSVRYWDKKNECVKKGFPNFVLVNSELKKQKDEAIRKRDSFIASDEVYTPQMILARDEVRNAVTNDLNGLIHRYIDEKGLEKGTSEKWLYIYNSIVDFAKNDKLLINEINEGFCRRYGKWLENKGMASGSIKSYMSKVVAILHYAHRLKLIDEFPLEHWKYHRDYRESKSELYIHHRTMGIVMEMFIDEMIIRNGSMWKYRENVTEDIVNRNSKLYAHYLFVIGYYLKGLAPVDISLMKKKDIKVRDVNGVSYYYFNGHRSKTGMEYRFYIPQGCLESNVLIRTMLMFNKSEYFLPNLNDYVGDESKKRINNVYSHQSAELKEWFRKINEEIARRNVENDDNIELIDLECSYYAYRHSYIMSQIQKGDVNLLKLATETGKALTSLHQYLTYLNDIDLV